jgi:hypothetical protein
VSGDHKVDSLEDTSYGGPEDVSSAVL